MSGGNTTTAQPASPWINPALGPSTDAWGWAWPYAVPAEMANRVIDAQALLLLERGTQGMRDAWQLRALRRMIAFVAQASPWWRDWMRPLAGVRLDELTPRHLALLPVMSRAHFDAATVAGALPVPPWHGAASQLSTSGSTGVPVRFFSTPFSRRMVMAHYWADHMRHGRDLRRKLGTLLMQLRPHPGAPHNVEPAYPWLGIGPVAARRSLDSTVREHAAWLWQQDLVYLTVTSSLWSGMLDEYEHRGLGAPRGLQQVLTFGETVDATLRRRTREITGASIRDRYSCEEVGAIALQCPQAEDHYHVCTGNVAVEVVDDAGQPCGEGVPGRVLLTAIHHWASPAIRYDVGDVAALHPQCVCGAQIPTLTQLLGRKRFLIRLPSGERKFLSPMASDWLAVLPVREQRMTQRSAMEIDVELVLDRPMTEAEHAGALELLRRLVDPSFTFTVRQVSEIRWAPGGKRQDVVSLV